MERILKENGFGRELERKWDKLYCGQGWQHIKYYPTEIWCDLVMSLWADDRILIYRLRARHVIS